MITCAEGTPGLDVTYFTDPLCCWSWGMQPHLDQWQAQYPHRMTIKYVMGGLLPSWSAYVDEVNAVSRPAQMGPVWMHAAQLTGRPIHHQLWVIDPPASSYPACLAVKCAALQSEEVAIHLFRKLQSAAMKYGQNTAAWPVIQAAAAPLSQDFPWFDQQEFATDFFTGKAIPAFQQDLDLIAGYRINRFPTIMVKVEGQKSILIPGYRTGEALCTAIDEAFPVERRQ